MRVTILGAGPAGLYLAYRIKRCRPEAQIRVIEQNRAGSTFGFGVVLSDRALEFLGEDDPQTVAALMPALQSWNDITVVHRGERVRIDGIGFTALGRVELLAILEARARSVGIEPEYQTRIDRLDTLGDFDLLVGADGVNSLLRRSFEQIFGARVSYLDNRFAWFGTTKPFETLTQTFRATGLGFFNAHHYRYAAGMSTFVVEVDAATFERAGLERRSEEESRRLCERVFADDLDGHELISNHSVWRRFPRVRNERWSAGRRILIGDALHTAHFSIGSGTRLAIEDAIALDKALDEHADEVPAALAAFELSRRPVLEKLLRAADASGQWYDAFAQRMALPPLAFAMSYVTRSGRVDIERLRRVSPDFVARWEREGGAVEPD